MTTAMRLIGGKEAAARIGISPKTLGNLARTGRIPAIKVGRCYRFDPSALGRWLESQTVGDPEPAPPLSAISPADLADLAEASVEGKALGFVLAELRDLRRAIIRVSASMRSGA